MLRSSPTHSPQNERGKGLGLQNSSLSLGFIIGSVAGGILLNWLGWRSIFYVRVPVGLILFLMALTLLRKDKPKATNIRFDIAGTLTSTAGLLSLILGLSLIAKLGLQSPIIYTLITAGLLFLALFIYVERKAEDATVDLSLFKNRTFSGAMVSLLFYWMAVQGLALTSPFYLMEGRSMAASYVGILFTVGTITSLLISPLSGSLSDRFGALSLSAIGAGSVLLPSPFGSASALKRRSSSLFWHSLLGAWQEGLISQQTAALSWGP
jgi:MFS family permease